MVLEPILGLLASVFGIIILLEDDALGGLVIKCKAALQVILPNLTETHRNTGMPSPAMHSA